MTHDAAAPPTPAQHGGYERVGVSLVDGDAAVRRNRQLMLRAEGYEVRSYATCAALLADPRSRDYPCVVLDVDLHDAAGPGLLRDMRQSGWRGKAVLIDGVEPGSDEDRDAQRHGDRIVARGIGDPALLVQIAALVDRSWAGWNG